MSNPICEIRNISKSFGTQKANHSISFTIAPGTIHALAGENGAGKSTAMKLLFGELQADDGEIYVDGVRVFPSKDNWNPRQAIQRGIAMVHQHFLLAATETALDNIVLGSETSKSFCIRNRDAEKKSVEALMKKLGISLELNKKVEELDIGHQALCEILKALYTNPRLLILDEPTAVMTPQEIQVFLRTLVQLKNSGTAILIVTHKLKEILDIADTITVLRRGECIATVSAREESIESLSEKMIGRRVVLPKISPFQIDRSRESARLSTDLIKAWPGEILGIAGVEGNGQQELIESIVTHAAAFIPPDRHHQALILDFSVLENLRLTKRIQKATRALSIIPGIAASENTQLKAFDVRPLDPNNKARSLSGGNQQKLIAAREVGGLSSDEISNAVIIAANPTRGVDVGAIEGIHNKLIDAAKNGATVILISSELDEIMSLSHRIGVLYRNKITSWFDGPDFDEIKIGQAMLGGVVKSC